MGGLGKCLKVVKLTKIGAKLTKSGGIALGEVGEMCKTLEKFGRFCFERPSWGSRGSLKAKVESHSAKVIKFLKGRSFERAGVGEAKNGVFC